MLNRTSATCVVALAFLLVVSLLFRGPAESGESSSRTDSGDIYADTVALGGGRFHMQIVALPGASIALLLAGDDPTIPHEIPASPVRGILRNPDTAEAFETEFAPESLPGDTPGMTSQFVAPLPQRIDPKHVEVSVPELSIGQERFRVALALHTTSTAAHHGDKGDEARAVMPVKIEASAEEVLYLTPGGVYTEADIDANGRMTASQRFKEFRAEHDKNPKPGDPICPVTETKANPKASWIIGGQTYLFCCPPCVDEFLSLAKETPEKVLPPSAYVQE